MIAEQEAMLLNQKSEEAESQMNRIKIAAIRVYLSQSVLLAHLWGAYAIPVALSGVRRPSFVVRRPSYVVCRLCPP